MNIPQNSKLEFYSGIRISEGETIPFRSRSQLEAYFAKHKMFTTEMSQRKFSYFRKTGELKVELTTKQVEQCNYLMFVNPDFENIKYYCRINDWEYVNNKTTRVYYDVDVWCTYFEKLTYEACCIDREQVSEADYQKSLTNPFDPTIYEFLTEEGLQVSQDMEIIYPEYVDGDDSSRYIQSFPEISTTAQKDSCVVFMIADFDGSQLGDIQTFNQYFDEIVDAKGNILQPGPDSNLVIGEKKINIGRAFSLYKCNVNNPFNPNSILSLIDQDSNVTKAVKWLDKQALTQQILGIFQIPQKAWELYLDPTSLDAYLEISPLNFNVHNKKLNLFPYQYLRVYNNEGDVKEYKYEKFGDIAVGDSTLKFVYLTLFDNLPMSCLIPVNYMYLGCNEEERMDCVQIPQVGYSTDAYLAFIANQMSKNLQEHTETVYDSLQQKIMDATPREWADNGLFGKGTIPAGAEGGRAILNDMGKAFGDVFGGGGQGASLMAAGGSLLSGDVAGSMSKLGSMPTWNYREAAREWRAGDNTLAASALASAKPAFVGYDYHPGSSNGTVGYYLPNNKHMPGSFRIQKVRLKTEYIQIYDKYFTMYGYKSGRYGIPRVVKYILNQADDLPHFATYGDVKMTYVKTTGMHVIYTKASVARAIEDMFNTGIRFIIPEDLPEV